MRAVTCSMGISLDGYTVGPDGRFDWAPPDPELFAYATDEVRRLGVHLLGRRLYEAMSVWETAAEDPALGAPQREFAVLWNALPKVVFSRTMSRVEGSYRLATGTLAEEVARWRAEPGTGDIALGGATLLAEAARLGLVDAYRPRVYPVLVGGGTPFFPRAEDRADLELVSSRAFGSGVMALHYRVVR